MFCSKCGKKNDDSSRFCAFCGAPLVLTNANNTNSEASALSSAQSVRSAQQTTSTPKRGEPKSSTQGSQPSKPSLNNPRSEMKQSNGNGNKKWILIVMSIAVVCVGGYFAFFHKTSINPFEQMSVSYSGTNGHGTATLENFPKLSDFLDPEDVRTLESEAFQAGISSVASGSNDEYNSLNGMLDFSCPIIYPNGKVNGELSNGDVVYLDCTNASIVALEDRFNIALPNRVEFTVRGLPEPTNIDPFANIAFDWEVRTHYYSALSIVPILNSSNMDQTTLSLFTYDMSFDDLSNELVVHAYETSQFDSNVYSTDCSLDDGVCIYRTVLEDQPSLVTYVTRNMADSDAYYGMIRESIYQAVNPLFDKLGWYVTFYDGGTSLVSSYELIELDEEKASFSVHTDSGDYYFELDLTVVANLEKAWVELSNYSDGNYSEFEGVVNENRTRLYEKRYQAG